MFQEWLKLKEHNEQLNFVRKQLNGPYKDDRQVQVGIFNALSTMLQWVSDDRYNMNHPWYVEMVMELEDLLPQLVEPIKPGFVDPVPESAGEAMFLFPVMYPVT